jgi:hypothetical protein
MSGSGTVAIRSSNNISSISDLGTGSYRQNFTNAFAAATYAVTGGAGNVLAARFVSFPGEAAPATTSVSKYTVDAAGSLLDVDFINSQIHGDLA